VATRVSRIVPTKTNEKWPLPRYKKLVCANDLITVRNIEVPSRIVVISCPLNIKTKKKGQPIYSEKVDLFSKSKRLGSIRELPNYLEEREYPSVFYGRGKGFHGIQSFKGVLLKSLLSDYFQFNKNSLMKGYFVVCGVDGYRVVISFSELFNRNDQTDFIIVDEETKGDKGRFRLFPAGDFFSDRAVFAVSEIHFTY
jgi:hypothetical protein